MAAARCAVSFSDTDGITHTARVQAESLYEAVALAVAEFRQDQLVPLIPVVWSGPAVEVKFGPPSE